MNICVYCRNVNKENANICSNCGYDLTPIDADINYKFIKLIDELKKENELLKKQSYHSYSNWIL